MTKSIVLTGGGTAGHVSPNIALIPRLKQAGYEIHYLGEANGMERELVEKAGGATFHAIRAGKLRRYFSFKNFTDAFRVVGGYFDAKKELKAIKPDAIFAKGGFVSVPVCAAGKKCKIPVVIHESDYTPGLANKLSMRYAAKVLVTFEDTLKFTKGRGVCTGSPIRAELFTGEREKGLDYLGFDGKKPVLLITGGSLGAGALNDAVRQALPELLQTFDVAHLCGRGKVDETLTECEGYRQFEFVSKELPHVFAACDVAAARAGANTIFEFLAIGLPAVLIPLPKTSQSRGDQILNAGYFAKKGYAKLLPQEGMTGSSLASAVKEVYEGRDEYKRVMAEERDFGFGTEAVVREILAAAEGR